MTSNLQRKMDKLEWIFKQETRILIFLGKSSAVQAEVQRSLIGVKHHRGERVWGIEWELGWKGQVDTENES